VFSPYALLASVAVLAATFGAGWWFGSDGKRDLEAQIEAAGDRRRGEVSALVVDLSARNTKLAEQLALERGRDQRVFVFLKGKVPEYVTPAADARCVVPRGFVLHHDAAWRGSTVPEAPRGEVERASGLPLSRVATVNAANAEQCRGLRRDLEAWERWYDDTQARWDAFARGTQGKP
jgi:hypothetical protein